MFLCNDYLMLMPAFSHYIQKELDAMPGKIQYSSPSDEAFLKEEGEETSSDSTHTDEGRGASTSKYCRARTGGGNGRVACSAVRKLEVGTSKARGVASMDINGAVAKEAPETKFCRNV